MAMYDMSKEVKQIAEITGKLEEVVAEELDLKNIGGEWTAWNRREESRVKTALQEAKATAEKENFQAAKQGDANAYKEPFFTKDSNGEWAVIARGMDFVEGMSGASVVRVRRRDGKVSVVQVTEPVDKTSTEIREWTIQ